MLKKLFGVALVSLVFGAVAGPATADIAPAGTPITMRSSNLNFQIFGFMNWTCNSGLGFTTPASGGGPVALTGDTTSTPRIDSCNIGTMLTGTGSTITLTPTGPTSNAVSIDVPGGGASAGGWHQTGTICGVMTFGPTTLSAAYTDGSTSMTINPIATANLPFTSTWCGAGVATMTGTFTLSRGLVVS